MSCAVTLSNLTARAQDGSFGVFRYGTDRLTTNIRVLPAGTYTITATVDSGVTCYIHTAGSDGSDPADLPASGEYTLPVTLTLSKVSKVSLYFGYAGFRDAPFGTWTPIDLEDVTAVNAAKSGAPAADTYETVVLRPDEIPDSDTFAKAVNSKSTIMLTVFPQFEAWRFAKRGETFVRVIDLDDGGMIFRGRVSKINDRMSANGAQSQVLTCLSAADFLEETGYTDSIALQALGDWLGTVCAEHNAKCELARRVTYTLTGAAKVSSGTDYIVKSHYGALTDVLTGGKYLSQGTGAFKAGYTMEWRERYQNDVTYIDIAERLGEDCDTAILIGDNLREINIERGLDGGLYTSVMAVSGVCADGYRMAYVAYNDDMLTRYGDGRQLVVSADDIFFTGEGGRDPRPDGGYDWYSTPATEAAEAALKAFAEQEAAKLSDPPVKITLSAADLAKMGYSGYEPFEAGNTYPVVYPPGGLFGRRMRLTAITRRLSDGQITSMTVECGEQPAGAASGSLSKQLTSLNAVGDDAKSAEIAATKAEEQTGGYTWETMTKSQYDNMPEHDDKTYYVVDNDGTLEEYIGDRRVTGQGGGGDLLACGLYHTATGEPYVLTTTAEMVFLCEPTVAMAQAYGKERITYYSAAYPGNLLTLESYYYEEGYMYVPALTNGSDSAYGEYCASDEPLKFILFADRATIHSTASGWTVSISGLKRRALTVDTWAEQTRLDDPTYDAGSLYEVGTAECSGAQGAQVDTLIEVYLRESLRG